MTKRHLLTSIVGLLFLATACSSSDDKLDPNDYNALKDELSVDKTSIQLSGAGEPAVVLQIKSNCPWTLSQLNTEWVRLTEFNDYYYTSGSGNGNCTLYVSATPNPSFTESRTTTIRISSGTITHDIRVTQGPSEEILSLGQNSIEAGFKAKTYNVEIESNTDWTVASDVDWCSASKNGNYVRITVYDNNTYSARSASVTVQGNSRSATIVVTQAAPSVPVISSLSVTDITKTSAVATMSYRSPDLIPTAYGICYSSSVNSPTRDNAQTISSYSSYYERTVSFSMYNLSENTTYYLYPFVETSAGIIYGNVMQFTTMKTNSPNEGDNPTPSY